MGGIIKSERMRISHSLQMLCKILSFVAVSGLGDQFWQETI